MDAVFEIIDKTGRKIHLSKERWGEHIRLEHPNIMNTYEIEETLKNPDKMMNVEEDICHYYKYFKYRNLKSKYLKIIVKYLNGSGFVITAYFERNIKIK
jgi:hypothetical protein